MRKSFGRLGAAIALTLAASAAAHAGTGLNPSANVGFGAGHSHSMYLKGGFLGAGVGYAYGLNQKFSLRADYTTIGTYDRSDAIGSFDYDLKLRNNVTTLSADFFPFSSGFRLTAGLGIRDTHVRGATTTDEFRGVALSSEDRLYGEVKWPTVTPYVGIGWGHNNGQKAKAGWGVVADLGVYYGRPDFSLRASDAAMAKLNAYTGGNGQSLIDAELNEWKDELDKFKFIPAIYLGVSYRF